MAVSHSNLTGYRQDWIQSVALLPPAGVLKAAKGPKRMGMEGTGLSELRSESSPIKHLFRGKGGRAGSGGFTLKPRQAQYLSPGTVRECPVPHWTALLLPLATR